MEQNAKPIHESGDRNALCPYYEGCLDHAVHHRWQSWSCSFCPFRVEKENLIDAPAVKDPNPEYRIPAFVVAP
jgi:hypothetical protein